MSKLAKNPKPRNKWPLTDAFLLGYEETYKGICYGDAWQRAIELYGRPTNWTGYSGVNPRMNGPVPGAFESYMDGEWVKVAGK